jgi:drug/metabolite transporter (DMT)-like permease
VLVGLAYAATLVLFVLANRLTTGANAIYLQSTSPFFLVLLAPWLLNEPPERRDIVPLVCVVLGLVLVLAGADQPVATAPDPSLGNGLALVSGLTYALLLIGFRWLGRADGHPDAAVASVITGNALAAVATLAFALPVVDFSTADLGAVLFLGVVQIGVAYVMVTRGMREVPALDASLLLLVEPALNPIWTWALLGERPTALAVMGGVAIAIGTVIRAGFSARTVTPVT